MAVEDEHTDNKCVLRQFLVEALWRSIFHVEVQCLRRKSEQGEEKVCDGIGEPSWAS
jgi:hypothetical protein